MWMLLFAGCKKDSDPDKSGPPTDLTVSDMEGRGAFEVGYEETSLTYDEPVTGDERTLRLVAWYPTDEAGNDVGRYQGVFPSVDVAFDAAPADGSFPLVVFSHGHQGYAENSARLMAHLASHGFVVFAPDHTGNTSFDDSQRETEIYFQRPLDISAVIDHALDDARVDASAPILAAGHSFGGYTLFALGGGSYAVDTWDPICTADPTSDGFCRTWSADYAEAFEDGFTDDRIASAVAMAPGDYDRFEDGMGDIDIPFLHMTGDLDQPEGSVSTDIWGALNHPDDRRHVMATAGHQTYTDISGSLDVDGVIDPDEGWRILNVYLLAWALWTQDSDQALVSDILDGTEVIADGEVTIRGH